MPDGLLIIDKPADWTSMDVCAKLRGLFHERRVGHAGTLDPMATGVLPVLVGRATKAASFAESGEKAYRAVIRLGLTSDTQDSTGTVLERKPPASEAALRAVLSRFRGEQQQIPPMYSALKQNGQRLYALAREGRTVERAPRGITVHALEVLEPCGPDAYALRVVCSKGTYIRTLCHDIGQALGCGAVMSALTRTRAAGFSLEEAVTLEEVQSRGEALLRPIDSLFQDCGVFRIQDAEQDRRCRCGNPLRAAGLPDGRYRVYGIDGAFLALSYAEHGKLTAIRNFF